MIYITGDTHADFTRFGRSYLTAAAGDYVIVCGDFGGVVWDASKQSRYWLKWLSDKPFTTLFVDGNHENYDLLNSYPVTEWNGGKVHFITDHIIHLMRGQVFDIDDIRFFTMGGASSHDIDAGILEPDDPDFRQKRKRLDRQTALYRVNHVSWWREELPSDEEMVEGLRNLNRCGYKVDVILTHCAPNEIHDIYSRGGYRHDLLTDYLEMIKNKCDFKYWFFGHYHANEAIGRKFVLLYDKILCLQEYMEM